MFQELKDYADFVKKNNIWDEAAIVTNFRSIMDYYIEFTAEARTCLAGRQGRRVPLFSGDRVFLG